MITGFVAAVLGTGISSLVFNSLGIYSGWIFFVCLCLITAILAVKLFPEIKKIAKMNTKKIKIQHDPIKNTID